MIRSLIDGLPGIARNKYIDGHNTAIIDLNVGQSASKLVEETDRLIKEIDKDIVWYPPPPAYQFERLGILWS